MPRRISEARWKHWLGAGATLVLLLITIVVAYPDAWNRWGFLGHLNIPEYRLGLDLQGGTHLVYEADMSQVNEADRLDALEGVKDVVERRVNAFGVSEPLVQTTAGDGHYRIIVELAGVLDVGEAIAQIGETPILEFKEIDPTYLPEPEPKPFSEMTIEDTILAQKEREAEASGETADTSTTVTATDANGNPIEGVAVEQVETTPEDPWINTELSGRHLQGAQVAFDPNSGTPYVTLKFNSEGATLFEQLTERNIGAPIGIFLDGELISAPVVNERIPGGEAIIQGNFTLDESKQLAQRLNAGALPVPITLVSQQTVGPTLGQASLDQSLKAALIGFTLVAVYMIAYYRLPGLLAVVALVLYTGLNLLFYKLFDVTVTLSGIAGLILSMGMAVDANVLIFERMREERRAGRDIPSAIEIGVRRAWPSIRDGNLTTLIASGILFWFSTSFIKGFALTLSIGILLSMFSALVITRVLMKWVFGWRATHAPFLVGAKSYETERR